jgi:serine protease Do
MLKYQLPQFKFKKLKMLKLKFSKLWKKQNFRILILSIFLSSIFGFLAGAVSGSIFYLEVRDYLSDLPLLEKIIKEKTVEKEYIPQTTQEEAIVQVVNENSPAVVSIVVTQYVEQYYFTPFEETPLQKRIEKKEIVGGTGFLISEDGMILTNKHVVLDTEADYTVLTNDGRQFSAQVLARDPVQDLAILKIEKEKTVDESGQLSLNSFPVVKLGDSENLQIGQTVIAIGNALGEFQNTVSVGVISGLGRTITASGGGIVETLEDVIQTDAAINRGNSGGPLLNLKGEVIGINTAVSLEGENIGFAIPINKVKKDIEQVETLGKIVYPFLGIRYVVINDQIQKDNNLSVNYGAWIIPGTEPGETAISPGSAAQKAGLREGDIILEFNGEKITTDNPLDDIIMKYNPGDKIVLKFLREGEEKIISVTLEEGSE